MSVSIVRLYSVRRESAIGMQPGVPARSMQMALPDSEKRTAVRIGDLSGTMSCGARNVNVTSADVPVRSPSVVLPLWSVRECSLVR